MILRVDYEVELESYVKRKIDWFVEEFQYQFGDLDSDDEKSEELAQDILSCMSKCICDSEESTIEYFSNRLAEIQEEFPRFFH
ncbi:MAG: hypothetical protein ACTSU5_08005 [Promethearchaeota archaeon]